MSKRIALIIHNDTYHDPSLSRLKMPVADIHTLAMVLRQPTIGNFNRVEILLNQPVDEVRRRVADLFHRKQQNDELLLYFIGHSLLNEAGQLYLATVDTALDSLVETAISAAHLTDCMDRSFSRRQMLLLECSYNQVCPRRAGNRPRARARLATVFKGRGYGRVVLTATHTVQYILAEDKIAGETTSLVSGAKLSRGGRLRDTAELPGVGARPASFAPSTSPGFTHYLIQGLQTGAADVDQDGQIELRELYEYSQGQAGQAISYLQPRQWTRGDPGKFIIARNLHQFGPARLIKWD
jgi:uncharacterized caspase-like protein